MKKSIYGTKPPYIKKETWNSLTDKERDYICLLKQRKYTKAKIMRRLYITTRQGYYHIETKVRQAINDDVKSFYKQT